MLRWISLVVVLLASCRGRLLGSPGLRRIGLLAGFVSFLCLSFFLFDWEGYLV